MKLNNVIEEERGKTTEEERIYTSVIHGARDYTRDTLHIEHAVLQTSRSTKITSKTSDVV
jgi:hypothetical protein